MHAAQGLLLQGGNAAGLIAGRGVFTHRLVVIQKVIFVVVDQSHRSVKHILAGAAVHQQLFGTEHLRHLGEYRAAAHGRQSVGDPAAQGVGGDAGQAVAAAAFQPDFQFADRQGTASVLGCQGLQFPNDGNAFFQFIGTVLAVEKAHPPGVVVTQDFFEFLDIVVLASQSQYQHAAGIGVVHQPGQYPLGHRQIVSQLAAPIGVGYGNGIGAVRQCPGNAVYAPNGGHDPNVVAYAHLAAGAGKAVYGGLAQERRVLEFWRIGVISGAAQGGAQVVAVYPLAGGNICCGNADGKAVFDHRLSLANGAAGVFVPVLQAHFDRIVGMYGHILHCIASRTPLWCSFSVHVVTVSVKKDRSVPHSSAFAKMAGMGFSLINAVCFGSSVTGRVL